MPYQEESFVESDIGGLYIGNKGTVINNTGIKEFINYQDHATYLGFYMGEKKVTKKLSTLVYRYHKNKGKAIPEDMTVCYLDGNPRNNEAMNLQLIYKKGNYHRQPLKGEIYETRIAASVTDIVRNQGR